MAEARSDDRWLQVPGVLHVLVFTALAHAVSPWTSAYGLGTTAMGVLLGIVAGNLWPVGARLKPGVAWVGKRVLAVAVILLGLQVTWVHVLELGLIGIAIVLLAVFGALGLSMLLGHALGVPARLAALIGTGTGICGASAIAAANGAVRAREEDVSYAVASITFLGSIGLIVYPLIQIMLHPWDASTFGMLAGGTLHSVPQALGAAFAGGGDAAGASASLVKLSRVALLAPVVLLLALRFAPDRQLGGPVVPRLPIEVVGFLALFVLGSVVSIPTNVLVPVATLDKFLLTAALTALGLQTRFTDLRDAGHRPFSLAVLVWLTLAGGFGTWLHFVS